MSSATSSSPTRSCLRTRLCNKSTKNEPSPNTAAEKGETNGVFPCPPVLVNQRPSLSPISLRRYSNESSHLSPVLACCPECDAAWKYGHLPSACNSDTEEDADSKEAESDEPKGKAYYVHWSKNARRRHDALLKEQEGDDAHTSLSRRTTSFMAIDELEKSSRHGRQQADPLGCGPALQRRWTDAGDGEAQRRQDDWSRRSPQGWAEHLGTSTVEFLRGARLSGLFM